MLLNQPLFAHLCDNGFSLLDRPRLGCVENAERASAGHSAHHSANRRQFLSTTRHMRLHKSTLVGTANPSHIVTLSTACSSPAGSTTTATLRAPCRLWNVIPHRPTTQPPVDPEN